ncbi:MAG: lamin tail domain-containing protein [Bacteroidales bacterium]
MKKILFVFFTLMASYAGGQVFFDFESQDLDQWYQYPANRWGLDSIAPIEGSYSLHHIFDNQDAGRDRLSFPASLDLKDTNLVWRFQVKYGYRPSGSNNWGFFLASDQDASEMHPSGGANGYVVGVNYSGSDDKIKLWRIASGSGYVILDTEFNWEDHINVDQAVGFEIIYTDPGLWTVKLDTNGTFEQLYEIGRVTDSVYLASEFTGIYHEYTSTADQKLWFDNIYIGPLIQDTLPPRVIYSHVPHHTALNIDFSEQMDQTSLTDPAHFTLINGDVEIAEITLLDTLPAKIQLLFDRPLADAFEYDLSISGLSDLAGNPLKDTILSFQYEKLRVDTLMVPANDSLLVLFSRTADTTSAKNPANYKITPDIGSPDAVFFLSDHPSRVALVTGRPFQPGQEYQLNISGIEDSHGDTLSPFTGNFYFSRTKAFDIVINEIMADPYPSVDLPEAEYIELYNRTSEAVDLTGWALRVDENNKPLPSGIIPPYQHVILCDEEYSDDFDFYGEVLPFPVFPVLRNSYADITLFSDKGLLMDSVSYHESWYQDEDKDGGGYSLERIDPDNHCSGLTNWEASADRRGGTPGEKNSVLAGNIDTIPPEISFFETVTDYQLRVRFSEPVKADIADDVDNYFVSGGLGRPYSVVLKAPVNMEVLLLFSDRMVPDRSYELKIDQIADYCNNFSEGMSRRFAYHPIMPYDIVINEIMADPEPSMGLPVAEYVEIYNNCDHEISLRDWKLVIGRSSVTLRDLSLAPGEYCILCDSEFEELFSDYGRVWGADRFPVISNSGEAIILEDPSGEIISFINFTDGWYEDEYKKEGGWALEQIDPDNPCGGKDNWAVSRSKEGGTPGRENSVFSNNPDTEPIQPLHITIVDSMTLLLHFNEPYDRNSVNEPGIFQVSGMGAPSKVLVQPPDFASLMLEFAEPFKRNIRYELIIRDKIMDCAGNEIGANSSLLFELPVRPRPGDLVINEVLFNPAFDGVDFVEIFNRSERTVDLKAVCLATVNEQTSEMERVSCLDGPGRLLFPGEYMVYTTDPDKVREQYHTAHSDHFVVTEAFPPYPNDAGTVLLTDKWMEPLDRLDYSEKMHFSLLKDPEGVTLERIHPDRATNDPTNWQSAAQTSGYGTPTYENSQFSEQSNSESTISLEPEVFSPDNDGKEDVVNVHYRFDQPGSVATVRIFDSKGRLVRHLVNNQTVGTEGFFSWDGLDDQRRKAKMGIYVIYVEVYNLEGEVRSYKVSCVLAGRL